MNFGLPEQIIQAIKKELQKRENVTRAVVFGSRARGDYRYNSDIDLAVYCEGELPPGLWLDLDEAAGIYKIDVIDMNGPLDEKLRQRIEEQGMEVYRRS
ncbi:MAG: nucleotidyltransferase domain-containing protein [Peptococcaceae bacterium]|jgi:predicted nucleotidyltransferase|nr:nucleotidyltransferase domain-containing protein [Peptococcaceae bacterium]MDH7525523.1 nucleotidyltransferase domain-containing protein [Peptococcaceae bacterium]